MAYTQQDLDDVQQAIASGESVVKSNGDELTYRSMPELLQAERVIMAALAKQNNPTRRRSFLGAHTRINVDRGF